MRMGRRDPFSGVHPWVNFLYFTGVLGFSLWLTHPLCQGISLLSACAYGLCLQGKKQVFRQLPWLCGLVCVTALINPLFSHQGVTVLAWFPSGNALTLESICYGLSAGGMLACMAAWFFCIRQVLTAEKFVWLFGRVAPILSLLLSMILGLIPKLRRQFRAVSDGEKTWARGQHTFWGRMRQGGRNLSCVTTWALEGAVETADSMRSRGYGLPGRTAFSVYRFTQRDLWILLLVFFFAGIVLFGGWMGDLDWRFYPSIRGQGYGAGTIVSLVAMLALGLLPTLLYRGEVRKWSNYGSRV